MDLNRLAIFANQAGGIEEAAEIIGIESDLIDKAVAGDMLTSFENAQLENAFNRIYLEPELNEYVEPVNSLIYYVNETERFLDDTRFADVFRSSIADSLISPEQLQEGYGLFANLTHSQSEQIIDLLQDESTTPEDIAGSIADMFDAYLADGGDIFADIEESEFWAWFRETFYE